MNLDILTVLYASGIVVASAGTSFVISTIFRRDDEVARLWGLGFITGMLATIAFAVWGYASDLWWVTSVANGALAFSIGAMWSGSRVYNERRSLLWLVSAIAVVVVVAALVPGPDGGEWAGAPVLYLAIAGFSAATVVTTLRGNLRTRINARILTVIFFAISIYYVARALAYVAFGETSEPFLVYFGTINTTLLNIGFLTIAAISFSVLQSERRPEDRRERSTDRTAMTGVASARLFEQQAVDWLRRAHRNDDALTFAIIEVQNLDEMNTALGSEFGDRAIQTVGWFTRDNVPTTSLVGRVSSRRFAVLTLSPAVGESRAIAERVMTAIAENPIDEIEGVRAMAAFGVSTTAESGYSYPELNQAALASLGGVV